MTAYKIIWTKTYYMTGEFTVEATEKFDAEVQAHCLVGDQEGTLNYIPSEDIIEVQLNDS